MLPAGETNEIQSEFSRDTAPMVIVIFGTHKAFVTWLIKSDGSILPFFSRPIAAVLAAMTIAALLWPVGAWTWSFLRRQMA
jgi:putative tricarboxylic transport membrane protein